MTKLLTETTSYDEPGSWGRMSESWPTIVGDQAYDMYVFANRVETIPYGSYVLASHRGHYGAIETCLRVHPEHVRRFNEDFAAAGQPSPEESIRRSEATGKLDSMGRRGHAPKWWA